MITDDRQYEVARAQAEKFEAALLALTQSDKPELHPIQKDAYFDALTSVIEELRVQITEYKELLANDE